MTQKIDYSKTVFLPKTDFPMKANLQELEPKLLAQWETEKLMDKIDSETKTRAEKFILHDGPPYANGNLHIGHAFNYILKDTICRFQRMRGKYVPFVNGSDCHGLPIEWKVEEKYRENKKNKDDVPPLEFRAECRDYAAHWVAEQFKDLKRLGIGVRAGRSYNTMTNKAESLIAEEIGKFLLSGALYKGYKAVMWSPVEKTALAEAEIEYKDHTSHTVWVKFPVVKASTPEFSKASAVIWTTTPWTLPANRAIAFGEDIDYVLVEAGGEKLIVAEALLSEVLKKAEIETHKILKTFKGSALAGIICHHPLNGKGYDFDVPMLSGGFVTTEQGTGLVHIAPGHGEDDFELGKQNGLEVAVPVDDGGMFYEDTPLFAGLHVYKAHEKIIEELQNAGKLLARGTIQHSYPHSWRSKKPVIFRATPQWFISMSHNNLREKALKAIDATKWVPASGYNRIRGMVKDRPDWCISRQRVWGVPIAIFVHKKTGEPLRDAQVMKRVVEIFEQEGSDAWFSRPSEDFLGEKFDAKEYEKVMDIVDVWFESGSTHAFVLEQFEGLSSPADLYVEGSDQHRGWFQSSLLESVGSRGRAPFEMVLTHGFVLDGKGYKMSKSAGNVIAPDDMIKKYGCDILRLWAMSVDYYEDIRLSEDLLKSQQDVYRRLRNTVRFLLGSLKDFEESEKVSYTQMPELEKYILHLLFKLDEKIKHALSTYDFQTIYSEIHNFCALDLSSFYFDVRKDSLYCDRPDSMKRRACRSVLNILFHTLVSYLAPALPFSAEEAWKTRYPEKQSVHLETFPEIPLEWEQKDLAQKWKQIRNVRRVVTGALEIERAEKRIGSSLESAPKVYVTPSLKTVLEDIDFAEVCITSGIEILNDSAPKEAFRLEGEGDVAVVPQKAQGKKCARCWKILAEVGTNPKYPDLSLRDADAVEYFLKTAPEAQRELALAS